ncbi:MAG TPA: TraB/GumN family protein [Kofleriaceae bacterium]
MAREALMLVRLVVLCLVAACGAGKPQCPLVEPATPGAPFLWKAHKGGAIVWLYGTIHDVGLDGVPKTARDAFEASPRLVSELGDATPDPDVFRKHARNTGKGIDQLLPSDDWYDLRDALLGKVKEDDLRRAKPWYAMSLLSMHLGPTKGPSMDTQLAEKAGEAGKPVEALEQWEEQLALLDNAVGVADLQEAIRARKTMKCDLARMINAYRAGDTETMQALLVIPRTRDTLLTPRNKKWLPAIEKQFAQGGAFVAVGLGHLLGDAGLVALLKQAGYTVERLPR